MFVVCHARMNNDDLIASISQAALLTAWLPKLQPEINPAKLVIGLVCFSSIIRARLLTTTSYLIQGSPQQQRKQMDQLHNRYE